MSASLPRCVVTGGAGFIGGHMVDRLLAEGHPVVVIDNLSTGRIENLAQHKTDARLEIVEADLNQFELIARTLQADDIVFHFAALGDIVPSIQRPADYYRANVDGTFSLLEAARAAGVAKLVYAASSSCYGIPDLTPTPETAEIRTEYPYALTKYLAEQTILHWAQVYGLPAISLRIFNAYGPRSRTSGTYGAVFGVFLAQKLAGQPFTIVGDGTQTRDFTFVTDVVDAFYRAARSPHSGRIYNLGTGNPQSVNELVRLLGGGETLPLPKRTGEPEITQADNRRLCEELGWQPSVSFEQGVATILENIDYWREAPVWTQDSIAEATEDWFRYMGSSA